MSESTSETRNPDRTKCSLLRRLLVMIYDLLPVIAIVFIAVAIALPFTGTRYQAGRDPGFSLYVVAIWFLYLGICWTRSGQTLGMRAWQVRIANRQGSRPTWRQSLIRFLMSLVSLLAAGAGFWLSLFRNDRACWHDQVSNTYLVFVPRTGKQRTSDRPPEDKDHRGGE